VQYVSPLGQNLFAVVPPNLSQGHYFAALYEMGAPPEPDSQKVEATPVPNTMTAAPRKDEEEKNVEQPAETVGSGTPLEEKNVEQPAETVGSGTPLEEKNVEQPAETVGSGTPLEEEKNVEQPAEPLEEKNIECPEVVCTVGATKNKFCTECGDTFAEAQKFCGNCGAKRPASTDADAGEKMAAKKD